MTQKKGKSEENMMRGWAGRMGSAVFFALVLLTAAAQSRAEGLRIYGLSAEAQSRGEAVIASGGDSSALWYNPAGLNQLKSSNLSVNLNNMFLYGDNTDPAGRKEKSKETYFTPFGVYYAAPLTEQWAAGIGVNTPFGLATKYDDDASFRYITTGGQVNVINIQPTVSYQLSSAFSIGIGANYYLSNAKLTQQYSWAPAAAVLGNPALAAAPDSTAKVKGSGDGYGFTTGLRFQPSEKQSLGITYHSQVVVKYEGDATLSNIPGAVQPAFSGGPSYKSDSQLTIRYPDIVALGYAFRPTDKLTWEVGGQWTNWNDFKTIDANLDQPTALFPNSSTPLYWKNGWVIRTGAEYAVSDKWAISGGYFYDKSPTRESTYTPLVPEGDHHVVSAGVRYNAGNSLVFRLPVVGIFQSSRNVNSDRADLLGNQVDGKYSLIGYQVGLSAEVAFGL